MIPSHIMIFSCHIPSLLLCFLFGWFLAGARDLFFGKVRLCRLKSCEGHTVQRLPLATSVVILSLVHLHSCKINEGLCASFELETHHLHTVCVRIYVASCFFLSTVMQTPWANSSEYDDACCQPALKMSTAFGSCSVEEIEGKSCAAISASLEKKAYKWSKGQNPSERFIISHFKNMGCSGSGLSPCHQSGLRDIWDASPFPSDALHPVEYQELPHLVFPLVRATHY
ncbi:hypothetical protein DUNSADRAFT_13353 [Dunaliella salina]|uniref:Uncharacterized protein n=1 Tax=Dunaliella salina TaxID=3046 RepID=A0ABQ7G9I0_DUNSA|nr:hypothetical protein DUNSADRAFT_13353 [Dunaliella salina]|eukprot:KAF5831270.1 hypothetical protein DUNSADRAFT_13353 [Dunaliella salina]